MPNGKLDLTVTVPAEAWNTTRQRITYLEGLLIGVADQVGLADDWLDVERLAGLWGGHRITPAAPPADATVMPAWVLPLMRLMRGAAGGDLASAWEALPSALPAGVVMPPIEEAAAVLLAHGLV